MWAVWLGNVWVRRGLLAVGVLALLWMVREHYVQLGEARGKEAQAVASAQEGEQQREAQRKDAVDEVAVLRAEIAAMDARGEALARAVQTSIAAAQQLAGARAQAEQQVMGIPAGDLHASNRKALGEMDGAYSEDDERKIAACLADRPLCERQSAALSDANTNLQQELALERKARGAQQQQFQALMGYTGALEQQYVNVYNTLPRKRNWWLSVVTLGFKGKAKKLSVPSLEEWKGEEGKAVR
jgi:hypothetical protein